MLNDDRKPTSNNQSQTGSLPPVPTDDMSPLVVEETTPPMLNDNDLPIVNTPPAIIADEKPSETDSGSAAPSDDVVMAPIVTTQKKKFAGGKIIATILGLFLLVGGVGAGTYLVQQNQDIRERAGACGGRCGPNAVCGGEDDNGNPICVPKDGGDPVPVEDVDVTWNEWQDEQQGTTNTGSNCQWNGNPNYSYLCAVGVTSLSEQPQLPPGATRVQRPGDGRWVVYINGVVAGEYRITGSGGGDEPPVDNPTTPPTTPPITASCQNIKAYSSTWALLTNAQLAQLDPGNNVNFCVTGVATGGSFNKAKFTINGVAQAETTTVRPSSTDFCQSYVIPAGVTTFNVTAQINHVTLGWK